MGPELVGEFGGWRIVVPQPRVVDAHLVLVRSGEESASFRAAEAANLLASYRAATSALQQCLGSTGFMINFALNWVPDLEGIGEPEPIPTARAVHVFGRKPLEGTSPVRVLAQPRSARETPPHDPFFADRLRELLAQPPAPAVVEGPRAGVCDGCATSVLTEQERWRADGVRVIRPHRLLIDPHVLLLPLRHVMSLRDLTPAELVSLSARLAEVQRQFRLASGCTGLTGFANDGVAARQETPHVHLHVYGRSPDEPVNPYRLLASRLPGRGAG